MARALTTKNLFEKKPGKPAVFQTPALKELVGRATIKGCWIVYGAEKNGKTWFSLKLAKELSQCEKVCYISAEEGLEDSFKAAVKRAGIILSDKNILWEEYLPIDSDDPEEETIIKKFQKQRSANIIVIDNLTMYADEIKKSDIKKKLLAALPNKLIIFLAHEERKQPSPALAAYVKKVANVIFHVVGLKVFITSRFAKGGELTIDQEKSELFWGVDENNI